MWRGARPRLQAQATINGIPRGNQSRYEGPRGSRLTFSSGAVTIFAMSQVKLLRERSCRKIRCLLVGPWCSFGSTQNLCCDSMGAQNMANSQWEKILALFVLLAAPRGNRRLRCFCRVLTRKH